MSDLDRSAQLEYILDHYQNPRNYGPLPGEDVSLEGGNPGCGDVITIHLKMHGDQVKEITFEGEGCTISQAAASILTEHVKGKHTAEIQALDFNYLIEELGEEMVKTRPRCSTLALDTLKGALKTYRRKQLES
ncbi:MAG: iron-sulfur cluster assembly scaffold protein [Chloroflexi bacterium]|jgi:nitrogen fixation NifU-like protein|nr:iron-sulfur cluster assembly scaffold protein [Anaerolineaceae bacterium]NMB89082.1 iron-sulfur cluster assembly scaffold protein [Chloroflexota bacterium]